MFIVAVVIIIDIDGIVSEQDQSQWMIVQPGPIIMLSPLLCGNNTVINKLDGYIDRNSVGRCWLRLV